MQTVQKMRDTSAHEKVYHMHICNKACLLCGYHTKDKNASGQTVHEYCMNEYIEFQKTLLEQNKDKCSMCGQKRKFVKDTNVCNDCLNSAF